MEVLASIFGIMSIVWLVFGLGFLFLGQQVGTWKRLTATGTAPWKRKLASIGFNYVMPAGIITTVVLVPLILLLGVVTFGAMFFFLL